MPRQMLPEGQRKKWLALARCWPGLTAWEHSWCCSRTHTRVTNPLKPEQEDSVETQWLSVLSFPPALLLTGEHQNRLERETVAATDTQQAGKISACTFPEVKCKDLTGVLTKRPQTYLLKQKTLPDWGFGRADRGRLISKWT